MKTVTADLLATEFSAILDEVEHGGGEVAILRADKVVARVIPEPPKVTALEFFSDPERMDTETADELQGALDQARDSFAGDLMQLRSPWAS